MKIQPSAGVIHSDTEAGPGSYWWQGAALVSSVLVRTKSPLARPMRVLMVGSCGWAIAAAYQKLGGPPVSWYGYEPCDAYRVAGHTVAIRENIEGVRGAWGTIDEVLRNQPLSWDAVIVDAFESSRPVPQWQSHAEVAAQFNVRPLTPIIIHGEVSAYSDKWRVVRA